MMASLTSWPNDVWMYHASRGNRSLGTNNGELTLVTGKKLLWLCTASVYSHVYIVCFLICIECYVQNNSTRENRVCMYILLCVYICIEGERDGESTLNLDIIWTSYSWTLNQYQLMNMNIISTMHDCIWYLLQSPYVGWIFHIAPIIHWKKRCHGPCVWPPSKAAFRPSKPQPDACAGSQARTRMHTSWSWYRDEICYRILLVYHIDIVSYSYGIILIRYQEMLIYTSIIHMKHRNTEKECTDDEVVWAAVFAVAKSTYKHVVPTLPTFDSWWSSLYNCWMKMLILQGYQSRSKLCSKLQLPMKQCLSLNQLSWRAWFFVKFSFV